MSGSRDVHPQLIHPGGFDIIVTLVFDEQMGELEQLDDGFSSLIEYGVSDEMVGLLAAIEDSTLFDGTPRYSRQTIYELKRKLLCYNHGPACFEAAHLLALVSHEGPGIFEFFWDQEVVTAARFRASARSFRLAELAGDSVELVSDNYRFSYHCSRINVTAAWAEFFVFILGPELDNALQAVTDELSESAIKALAGTLQKRTYEYLKDNLQPQTQMKDCWNFLKWLRQQDPDTDIDLLLNDDHVFEFWRVHGHGELGNYRRFVSVAEIAFNLLHSLELGQQRWQLDHAASHSTGFEDGDAWINQLSDNSPDYDESLMSLLNLCDVNEAPPPSPVQTLREDLKHIKFLTATDLKQAEPLQRPLSQARRLPDTLLRMELFGQQQALITGDLQNQGGRNIGGLIACGDMRTPDAWQEELQALQQKMDATRSAIAHILVEHEDLNGITVLLEVYDSIPRPEETHADFDLLIGHIQEAAPLALKDAAAQFRRNNRQGFKSLPDAALLPHYVQGDAALQMLSSSRQQVHGLLDNYQSTFEQDRHRFQSCFQQLYGERL